MSRDNNFVFDDHNYLQISTTAMDTMMAPCFANLFMASNEETLIDNSSLKPLLYVRCIEDVFMILTHGREEHEKLTTGANTTHPSKKITTEISSTSLPFLDVLLSVTVCGIQTSLYRRKKDCLTYLMYYNFHSHHIKS